MSNKKDLSRLRKIEAEINRHLYWICGGITVVVMATLIIGFFSRGSFPPAQMNLLYIGILIIYSAHKEILRWLGEKHIERQGEFFVYLWVALAVGLYLVNFATKGYFSFSPQGTPLPYLQRVCVTTLEVAAIFILTRGSKLIKIFSSRTKSQSGPVA